MRYLALLPLLCACSTLTLDEQQRLAHYQRNAAYYWEDNHLEQTLSQVERGLEIDPDDYKLNAIRGAVLLRASGNDRELLDQATVQLEKVYEMRSQYRHEPHLLFNYALVEQKQGLRRLGDAIRLEGQAQRTADAGQQGALLEQATGLRDEATERLRFADELLAVLVDRGELLLLAHNHRLQIALQLGNDEQFRSSSEAYFKSCAAGQEQFEKNILAASSPEYEREQMNQLRELRAQEVQVRSMVADWNYQRGNYEASLTHLNRALELDPQRSEDYYNRARVIEKLQGVAAAKADFTTFLATSQLPPTSDKYTYAVRALQQ